MPKSIKIRSGTITNLTVTTIANPISATVRDNTLIVCACRSHNPYDYCHDVEVCRFHDAFIARQAYDIVDKAIREGWETVDLLLTPKGQLALSTPSAQQPAFPRLCRLSQ